MTLKVEIKRTLDGSDTLFVPELNEHYHSTFGAVQESGQVFIENGLMAVDGGDGPLTVFEVGFGTGLNALLTVFTTKARKHKVHYSAIELHPLGKEIWERLNYPEILGDPGTATLFQRIHEAPWEMPVQVNSSFRLTKINADLRQFNPSGETFNVIYFDAFAPDIQPDMWTKEVFGKMFRLLRPGGVLVTYSCKGNVKRNLKGTGFSIEKLPGPPGKREVLRARKK